MFELPSEWTPERKWKATARARSRYIGELERAIYEKWGKQGLEVIGKVWAQAADRTFEEGLKGFKIEGRGALAFASFFVHANSVLGLDMELVEGDEERAVFRIHNCHIFPDPKSVGGDICRWGHFKFEERAAQLLNPRFKVRATRLQTEGDPYCECLIELEKG